jgi:hypothetical protein
VALECAKAGRMLQPSTALMITDANSMSCPFDTVTTQQAALMSVKSDMMFPMNCSTSVPPS